MEQQDRGMGRRRVLGGTLAVVLAAGVVGGGAGSAVTAAMMSHGGNPMAGALAPAVADAAAPQVVRTSAAAVADSGIKAIYKQVSPAVVSVETAAARASGSGRRSPNQPGLPNIPGLPGMPGAPGQGTPNGQNGQGGSPDQVMPTGEGSGFILDADGSILTNYHVVEGASRVTVVLQGGTRVQADVVGSDPGSDLALLRATIPTGKAAVVPLGDSDAVEPGDTAIAIGTPFGLDHTVTAGIVSATNRDFGTAAGRPMRGLLQTDAPINPGNSGGPLLNDAGQVIGITTSIESPVRGSVGIGFAIPINQAKSLLPQLRAGQSVQHAWLGISGQAVTEDVAARYGLPAEAKGAVLVMDVQPNSPAAGAGLRGTAAPGSAGQAAPAAQAVGDVILAVDGRAVQKVQDVATAIDAKRPGDTVTLTILRDGSKQDVKATLAAWPDDHGA